MYVVNRKGDIEDVAFDKITERIRKLCGGLDTRFVDPVRTPPTAAATDVYALVFDRLTFPKKLYKVFTQASRPQSWTT